MRPVPWQKSSSNALLLSWWLGCFVLAPWTALAVPHERAAEKENESFLVGVGSHDITASAADLLMMGYGSLRQTTQGIHQRLWARAFILGLWDDDEKEEGEAAVATERHRSLHKGNTAETPLPLNPDTTICFVSADIGMGSDLLNLRVIERLSILMQQQSVSRNDSASVVSPCQIENLSISATHTHSAPGGYFQYAFYQVPSLGYRESVVETYAEGIAQALWKAYENLERNQIHTTQSSLIGASRNRSPTSYLLNPMSEIMKYIDEGDTDKTMLQLTFHTPNQTDNPRGFINWFAVHGTSMNSSNRLISGDNKGYASYLAERYWNGNDTLPGAGTFVAAFASTNLGDVSPNTAGSHCIDTGAPCDDTSACHGDCRLCRAAGPGAAMLESTEIIGRMQFEHSLQQILHPPEHMQFLHGPVAFRHSFVDMSQLNVTLLNGDIVQTCPAALGYSFAAGTTDGPGEYPFVQGTNASNPLWNMLGGFLSIPTVKQKQCQAPKPILFNIGQASVPYRWSPSVVPISIFRVGQLFILNVPAEFTTMAGRRLRTAVNRILVDNGMIDETPIITIAGLANSYSGYVTTFEEYAGQRYEAASTLFGPHTLSAYIQEFERLALDIISGNASATLNGPRDRSSRQISFRSPMQLWSVDTIGLGKSFGSVVVDAEDSYLSGETVIVSFRSANPYNNLRIGGTFLTIDRLDENDGSWQTRFVDSDWCTQFHWKGGWTHERFHWGTSFAEISWDIPRDTPNGMYRVCHYGTRQTLLGALESTFLHDPIVWFSTTVLGSYMIHLTLHILDFVYHVSGPFRNHFSSSSTIQKRDFHGCSRTFLVR